MWKKNSMHRNTWSKAIMAIYKQLAKINKLFHTDSMKFPN